MCFGRLPAKGSLFIKKLLTLQTVSARYMHSYTLTRFSRVYHWYIECFVVHTVQIIIRVYDYGNMNIITLFKRIVRGSRF